MELDAKGVDDRSLMILVEEAARFWWTQYGKNGNYTDFLDACFVGLEKALLNYKCEKASLGTYIRIKCQSECKTMVRGIARSKTTPVSNLGEDDRKVYFAYRDAGSSVDEICMRRQFWEQMCRVGDMMKQPWKRTFELLMKGKTQTEIMESEGISWPAIWARMRKIKMFVRYHIKEPAL